MAILEKISADPAGRLCLYSLAAALSKVDPATPGPATPAKPMPHANGSTDASSAADGGGGGSSLFADSDGDEEPVDGGNVRSLLRRRGSGGFLGSLGGLWMSLLVILIVATTAMLVYVMKWHRVFRSFRLPSSLNVV